MDNNKLYLFPFKRKTKIVLYMKKAIDCSRVKIVAYLYAVFYTVSFVYILLLILSGVWRINFLFTKDRYMHIKIYFLYILF